MIIDMLKNLCNYPQFTKYTDTITEFVKRVETGLPDGRYDLDGNKLFALVQHYTTKPASEGRFEAHEKYADLQYIVSGREYIYSDYTDNLEIEEDCRPNSDIFFLKSANASDSSCMAEYSCSLIRSGTFGYYAPSDAHMPGIQVGAESTNCKIVFKFLYESL